ncbi:DHA1 family bicyclomycin/chloramphenicol resistance-like MFS transporter [Streptomyces turgidiscabies]|uniref:DHA1 family bicyclomycin/chloramphenicol resistance-like MFS transporter n=1 Tax=Streptomyces turgidiscabies TaxID=85558 RepID=A0ABU0RYD0_9ACTN|nr:DHA1 family bicyclomycin/chloramphenicol resistance-like MFS transporter [Streptomyces turgidiscabies]
MRARRARSERLNRRTAPVEHGTDLPATMLLALALAYGVSPLAIDMYLSAFPRMARDLHASATGVQLTLTAFMTGLAVGQLLIGPLSDRWGRRRPLLAGTAVSVLAGLLCAAAPSVGLLVAARFVHGVSGAAGIVIARAVVGDRARGAGAARAYGLLMMTAGVAPVVAPLLGGALVGAVGWRGIFLVLAGLAALTFLGALFLVPETLPPDRRSGGGLATTLRRTGTLLADRPFLGYAFAFAFGFGTLFSYLAASPFVYQNVFDLSIGTYAVILAANAVGFTATSALNRRIVRRFGARLLLRVGLVVMAVCSTTLCLLAGTGLFVRDVAVPLVFATVSSLGLIAANATALAVARAPQAAGSASAIVGALQFGLAATVSPLVGLGGENTAVPMAVAMAASTVVAGSAVLVLAGTDRDGDELA